MKADSTNSTDRARIVRALTSLFVCLFAVLSFVGCSQRAKDDADRQVIVGVWEFTATTRIPDGTGIMRISSDGTYSTSNNIPGDSVHTQVTRVTAGKWNITNGELVKTDIKISSDGDKHPPLVSVERERIVRITDQELVLVSEVSGVFEINFYITNIFRRAK